MKLYVTYGFFMALAGAVLTLALFALGYHTDNIAAGEKWAYLGIVIAVAGTALGMREWRNEVGKGIMSYGRGLGTGILICVWSALFTAIFNAIYFTVINPGYSEAMVQYKLTEMQQKNMPPQAMEQAEHIMRLFMKSPVLVIMGFIMTVIFGVVISLILAAIFKSEGNQSTASAATPPPVQS